MNLTVTITLTEEEQALIDTLRREQGLDAPADVLRTLLHDAVQIYDALWDKSFAESQDFVDKLADDAHAAYLEGLTEDFELK